MDHTTGFDDQTARKHAAEPSIAWELDRQTERGNDAAPGSETIGALALRSSGQLGGRGNGPARVAAMKQAQQTYGNRAVQRKVNSNPIWKRKIPYTAPWLTPAEPEWKFKSGWPARISEPSLNSAAEENPTPAQPKQPVAPAESILARWPYTRSSPGKTPNPSMLEEEPTP